MPPQSAMIKGPYYFDELLRAKREGFAIMVTESAFAGRHLKREDGQTFETELEELRHLVPGDDKNPVIDGPLTHIFGRVAAAFMSEPAPEFSAALKKLNGRDGMLYHFDFWLIPKIG